MQQARILISGGGIGGLTSAIALRQRGFSVTIAERDPEWSVYGVGIIQQANVVRAIASLGLLDAYVASAYPFDRIEMFAPDGTQVASIPSPRLAGGDYPAQLGISRPALQRVLADAARSAGTEIRLGASVERFEDDGDGVGVRFTDGTCERFDLLVGADGLYSQTRAAIFPDAPGPAFTGQSVWRYNLPRPAEVECLQAYTGRVGLGLVPLSADTMYMFVTSPEPGNPHVPVEGRAAAMRQRLAGVAPRIAALAEQITDDRAVVYKPLEALYLEGPWHKGRVVLIGDAVHGTTPHLGQGAGMAIEDSIVLADELARHAPEPAFAAYQARREGRCRFIVESSVAVGEFQLGRRDTLDYPALTREMFERTAKPV
ncbi:2-polyprenyl-6-methoxyphenol hydroxylase [Sphingomonas ginkgonis]|uniref:2-polyprenyl-6-methoxyphenol hydroxylase n=1 Tax=Sphingomonas ginkgonis TaxID=2315330 RepID=A0A3R9WSF3_9SPHN|nr:FAD-dependent oxidoreductase [Sphingomonas ginkgonis]RST30658.1 2-polyprenyl-6-methoxyphenol hydroxylase [Sphingomonas ginkgonis]